MLNTLFFVFLKFLNCGERHVRCTTLNIFKFHSTALNTFALLCNQPQKSSSCWTEQSPDRYNRLGVTVTRLARGSLPTPARRQVPSTITQKLNRQPRACAATAQSRGHTAAGPPPCADSAAVRGPCPGDLWGPGLLCRLSRDKHGMQRDEHRAASLFQIIICNTGMKAASEFCLLGRSTVQVKKKTTQKTKTNRNKRELHASWGNCQNGIQRWESC